MGNRPTTVATPLKNQLRTIMHEVAASYILKAPFDELRQLSTLNAEQLNKYVFLTAEILNQSLNDREIEYLYQDIKGNPRLMTEPVIFFKEDEIRGLDVPNPQKKRRLAVGIARFYIRIFQVFAAIMDTLDPDFYTILDKNTTYQYDPTKMEHEYRADDGSGFLKAVHMKDPTVDSSTYKNISRPISLCGSRLWALTGKWDPTVDLSGNFDYDEVNNRYTIKNHICDVHTNKAIRPTEIREGKKPDAQVQAFRAQLFGTALPEKKTVNKIVRNPKQMKNELGINSLEQLFLNSYDLIKGQFRFASDITMSGRTMRVNPVALEQYRTLIKKYTEIFGDPSRPTAGRLSEIIMSPIHLQEYCRGTSKPKNKDPDADALLHHSIKVRANSPKLAAYIAVIRRMKMNMDSSRKKLIGIINAMFIKTTPSSAAATAVPATASSYSLNPRLNEKILEGLVEQTRVILSEMYARCHLDFLEATRIFVDIAKSGDDGQIEYTDADRDDGVANNVLDSEFVPLPIEARDVAQRPLRQVGNQNPKINKAQMAAVRAQFEAAKGKQVQFGRSDPRVLETIRAAQKKQLDFAKRQAGIL